MKNEKNEIIKFCMSMKMRSSVFFIIILSLCSCTTYVEKNSENGVNPLSQLFAPVDGGDIELLKTELKSSTLKFDCSKRSDQPYYWCGLDGDFRFAQANLPEKMETIFHVQLPLKAVNKIEQLVKQYFKKSEHFTIVIQSNPQIDPKKDIIWSQLFAFYDDRKCVAFLGRVDLCPESAAVMNIY